MFLKQYALVVLLCIPLSSPAMYRARSVVVRQPKSLPSRVGLSRSSRPKHDSRLFHVSRPTHGFGTGFALGYVAGSPAGNSKKCTNCDKKEAIANALARLRALDCALQVQVDPCDQKRTNKIEAIVMELKGLGINIQKISDYSALKSKDY